MLGVKTGTTDRAGECLTTMVRRPAGECLSVVLGSEDRFLDTRLLLDYFYASYAELQIDLRDTPQNRYLDAENHWHPLRLRQPLTMLVQPYKLPDLRMYRRIEQPLTDPGPEDVIGTLEVTIADDHLTEVPLYAR
jgi:D-alanyl-D-alanine carboxypeptidase